MAFITLEGGEGAGKSTQAARLTARLRALGHEAIATREPGGSVGAEAIRALLVNGAADRWSPAAETLLMYAARLDHVERTIAPALLEGTTVVCDRFADSTRAYQGAGGGASAALIDALEHEMRALCWPDLTLVFDLDAEAGLARAAGRAGGETRFEAKGLAFHQRLRAAFLAIAAAEPERCVLIDASADADAVEAEVWRAVSERLLAMSVDLPHPRDTFDFEGGEAVERAFLEAMARGRLHHAWLLAGPEGVGKTTFAYRAARRLLGAAAAPAHGLLGAAPDDRVCRLVAGKAHPDLLVLQRDPEDGKSRKQIPVEEARGLAEFFAKTPAMAPWRVAIIDAADDLNPSGANALLKTLEEPPERGAILLVCHRPGALLPTIRSRCRALKFSPPPTERTAAWLAGRSGAAAGEAERLAQMAQGAPGRAWRLASVNALATDEAARALLAALPVTDPAIMLALADGFRGAEGAERFAILCGRLAEHIHHTTAERALAGERDGLDAWAEAFEFLAQLPGQVEAVNLDRGDAFFTAVARLRAVASAC